MNKGNLVIFDFDELYKILRELRNNLNFDIINLALKDKKKIHDDFSSNDLFISKKKIPEIENQILISNFPIKIDKLIEKVNIKFLNQNYSNQSKIHIGKYIFDLNSREMKFINQSLKLTEKECEMIVYLSKSKKPVSVSELQSSVWGYQSQLETHTVETHIYRIRKKMIESFSDDNFIKFDKKGYFLN